MKADQQLKFWNSFAGKYDRFIARFVNDAYEESLQLISKELKSSDTVLEVGTGTGLVAFSVASKVKDLVATDYAPEMIRLAREKLSRINGKNVIFEVCRPDSVNYPDKSFDVIIASNVLHLIPGVRSTIREFHRLLNDKGKIIVPTYCHGQNPGTRIISAFMGLSGFKAVNRWNIKQFRSLIENGDFVIEREVIIKDKIPLAFLVALKKDK